MNTRSQRASFSDPRLWLSVFAAVAIVVTAGVAVLLSADAGASHSGGPDAMSIDMNAEGTPANTATLLGTRETCMRINENGSIDADEDSIDRLNVDVTVTTIPVTNRLQAFQYFLVYSAANLRVSTQAHNFLIEAAGGTANSFGDGTPDTDGSFAAAVLDFTTNYESGSGVLSRLGIESNSSAAAGEYSLTLTPDSFEDAGDGSEIIDEFALSQSPDAINNASVAINVPCGTSGVYEVDTTSDSAALTACTAGGGDCSLRGAMANAAGTGGSQTIVFNPSVFASAAPGTITLTNGTLPDMSGTDFIDATGRGVIISGNSAVPCFSITGSGNTILAIQQITGCNVVMNIFGANNTIGGTNDPESGSECEFGGPADDDNDSYFNDGCPQLGANAETGFQCNNSVDDDDLLDLDGFVNDGCPSRGEGIRIHGNAGDINISGDSADGNVIKGNWIGLDAGLSAASANAGGIDIENGADNNTIGGTTAGDRNVISGNTGGGIGIGGSGSTGNVVKGNYVGLNAAGTAAVANGDGILIYDGATANTIGGTLAGERNVISGNTAQGVRITGSGTSANVVLGNHIGVNGAGTAAVANAVDGVRIDSAATGNTIGGTNAAELVCTGAVDEDGDGYVNDGCAVSGLPEGSILAGGYGANCRDDVNDDSGEDALVNDGCPARGSGNVVSGNAAYGVRIDGAGTNANVVKGNIIGSNADSNLELLGNGTGHILITGGAQNNTVGGSSTGDVNLITGSDGAGTDHGVSVTGATSSGNVIKGNTIGLDYTGSVEMNITGAGVHITAPSTTVGGTLTAERNTIAANTIAQVLIDGASATGNTVLGNYLGLSAGGWGGGPGVAITGGAASNTIGGTAAGARNVISGTGSHGVQIAGSATTSNVVAGNYIGTNPGGTGAIGNNNNGVEITDSADNNTIGGLTVAHRNVISGNSYGVVVASATSSGNLIWGNYIGTNAAGTASIANTQNAVHIAGPSNTVGGTTPTPGTPPGNVLSGNSQAGISIFGEAADNNLIYGNLIGTDAAGTADLGNGDLGVYIISGADGTLVGSATAGTRNVISGNTARGVGIFDASTTGNIVAGNYIGTNINGTALASGTQSNGVTIANSGASGNTIGGSTAAHRNIISGNTSHGIRIGESSSANSNTVQGNYIGIDVNNAALGNGATGIIVDASSSSNTIGGEAGEGNTIANNGADGVFVSSGTGNSIRGNSIYLNGGLGIDLDPNGVTANDAGDGDTGANNLMNFPVISSASYNASTRAFTVSGTLDTEDPDTATVDLYATDVADGSGNGEGRWYLGSAAVSGLQTWTFNGTGIPQGGYTTATATKAGDGTSEFSAAFDADVDGDGFPSSTDTCDIVFNPFQIDHDGDGIGDVCDNAVRNRFTATQSSLRTEFTVAAGDQLPQEDRTIAPWDFQVGSSVNIGALAGESDLAFGLRSASGCDFGFSQADIKLINASTDNSPGNVVSTANILADGDGDTIVDGVEGYPSFLNTIYDPERQTNVNEDGDGLTDEDGPNGVDNDGDTRVDEDGAGTPAVPHARYLGVYGGNYFQVLVWEEDADDRYRMEIVFNDPTGFPGGVSCAPFEYTQTIFTTSVTNTDANPDVTGGQAVLVNPGTGTRVVRGKTVDRPDADGDLQDNWVDNCKLIANATQVDGDGDGIGDACDPTPAVNTGSGDHDSDTIGNIVDNCPTITNSTQAEGEVRTPPTFGVPSVDDFIGDACDPNPLRTDDVHYTINPPSGRERRGVHINEFSDPICITGGGVVDADSDGWCVANDPNDGSATIGPENEGLVLPASTGTYARGLCNNGYDDDAGGGTDFADSDCADADGDFIPDNVDICDAAADPLQLDADADGIGDACEANPIVELDAVSTSNAANSELRWRLVEPAPKPLHSQDGILQLIDSELDGTSDWGIVGGASVTDGAIRATLTDFVTVGIDPDPLVPLIGNRPCINVLPLNFTLLDASTDPNDSIDPGATLTALGADGDADGLVNGVEQYPAFLKSLPIGFAKIDNDGDLLVDEDPVDSINNDGDGLTDEDPTEAVAPLVRMFGYTVFQGAPKALNILVYGVGALPALPNTEGYPVVMVYDNPYAYTPRYNVQATCSHQDHRMSSFGVSVDFPGTVANEGGIKLMNNDSAATTERFFTRITSQPDQDGDLIENHLDACPFDADNDEDGTPDQSDIAPWNPRLLAAPGDPDNDGLPNKCDPNDFVPSPPGSPSDEDGDGIGNDADNCRTLSNSNQQDSDADGLGNACDPNTMLPSGAVQRLIFGHPICTDGTNLDGDGYCTDVDPNDNDENRVPETGVFDPSVCSNAVNDDFPEDNDIDLDDDGCGDIDGDQVLNEVDNCKTTKNGPAQAGQPGFGNQVDSDNDVGASHLGQQPFARTDLGDPFVVGEPFARTSDRWGGDACDVDDDNDNLPDGNECDEVDDGDGYTNDGCTALGLFSEGDLPLSPACTNATDEADEDSIATGNQNDDTVPNDGCPVQGPVSEDKCRTDPDCDDDMLTDLFEWTYSCDVPSGGPPDDLDMDLAVSPNARSNNLDLDVLFTYGEQEAGTNPCVNNNSDVTFGSDHDLGSAATGDDYLGAHERYMGTSPTDNCQAGLPSSAWPADLSNGFQSVNKLTILDLSQYIAPVRRINTSPGHAAWNRRFDLIPGPGAVSEWVNILDLTNLLQLTPAMSPYNSNKAFNHAGACPP